MNNAIFIIVLTKSNNIAKKKFIDTENVCFKSLGCSNLNKNLIVEIASEIIIFFALNEHFISITSFW